MPLISVIVPCYNQAQYLDECLQSVLDQTYQDWECIIVNDGSPDNTEEVAKKWLAKDSRFKYLYKENGGLSSARNAGIKIAVGDFIQFLDCDDILEPNKLIHQTSFFTEDVDVYVAGYRYFENEEGREAKRIMGRNHFLPEVCLLPDDQVDLKNLFKIKNPFVICAPLYKRALFDKTGSFNEQLKSLEDWEFNLRCALHDCTFIHTGYGVDNKVLVRLHGNSMMRDYDKMMLNEKLMKNILNSNDLYVKQFGIDRHEKNYLRFKRLLSLFAPPIIYIIKRKINETK